MVWIGLAGTQRQPLDAVPALTDFLHQRNLRNARIQNRSKLSPEELQALSDELNSSGRVKPMDADATKANLCGIKKKWVRYGDWRRILFFALHLN
jgi:hypothetical protein